MKTALLPAVKSFLAAQPLPMYVGGRFVPAAAGQTFETRDPGTGEVLAKVAAGDAADVDAAVAAAQKAFHQAGWAAMPSNDRAVLLHRLADLVDKHAHALAQIESLDVGKPLAQAAGFDIPDAGRALRYFADLAVHTRLREPIGLKAMEAYTLRVPYGACGFILPWNFPFMLLGWNLAPAWKFAAQGVAGLWVVALGLRVKAVFHHALPLWASVESRLRS